MLRIIIDGNWTAKDFGVFYSYLDELYLYGVFFALIGNKIDEDNREILSFVVEKSLDSGMRFFSAIDAEKAETTNVPHLRSLISALEVITQDHELVVRRITFASPGFTDLLGAGKGLEYIRDIIFKVADIAVGWRERKLKNDLLETQVEMETIRLVGKKIELLKELGYSNEQCISLISKIDQRFTEINKLSKKARIEEIEFIDKS